MKWISLIIILMLIPISFAEEFGYNLKDTQLNLINPINYSQVNVNNSDFLDGYDSSDFVTYTGALSDVDLGSKSLSTTGIIRRITIPVVVDTASATASKTATIADYTLTDGDLLAVRFTLGNSVSSPTLNINGVGANSIVLGTTAVSTTTFTLGANATALLYYDANGNVFRIMGSQRTSDSDTTYNSYHYIGFIAGENITRYKWVYEGIDGKLYPFVIGDTSATTKQVNTQQMRLGSSSYIFASSTTDAVNTEVAPIYDRYYATSTYASYGTNGIAHISNNAPFYLKGIIDSNSSFILDNSTYTSWLTDTLPTTDDGFVYIRQGVKLSNNYFYLEPVHPIYWFKDGELRLYNDQDLSGYFTLDQSTTQNIDTGTGYINFTEVDLLGAGLFVFPKLSFHNENLLGFDKNIGVIDKGLIIQDGTDTEGILSFIGSSIAGNISTITYGYDDAKLTISPSAKFDGTTYSSLIIEEQSLNDESYILLSGLSNESQEIFAVKNGLFLYKPDGDPAQYFVNGATGEITMFSITEDGLYSVGGLSTLQETESESLNMKQGLKLNGALFGGSDEGDRIGIRFSDGAVTGLGGNRNLGLVTGIIEEQGASWAGGLTFDVFEYTTNGTDEITAPPITALYISGETRYVGIGQFSNTTTPSYPLHVTGNASGISIWAEGNISATGYITRTSIYESKDGKGVWDYIQDSSYYLDKDGKIQHDKFYGYTTDTKVNYDEPVYTTEKIEKCDKVCSDLFEQDCDVVCKEVEVTKPIYPFFKVEEGVSLDEEVNVLRQGLYELHEENIMLKTELCSVGKGAYSWCK